MSTKKKTLLSKGNYQQNGKANCWIRKDICKWQIWQGVNIQNIQRTQKIQLGEKNFFNEQKIILRVFFLRRHVGGQRELERCSTSVILKEM